MVGSTRYGAVPPVIPTHNGENRRMLSSSTLKSPKWRISTILFTCGLLFIGYYMSVFDQISPMMINLDAETTGECADVDGTPDKLACCTAQDRPVLGGVDVVSYHQIPMGSPSVMGSADFQSTISTSNGDFIFYFSTQENLELFEKDHWSYAPEMGGFDAQAISSNDEYGATDVKEQLGPQVDVNQWAVIHGKLYLFGSALARRGFMLLNTKLLPIGDLRWATWYDNRWVAQFAKTPNSVFNTVCIESNDLPDYVPPPTVDLSKNKGSFHIATAEDLAPKAVKYDFDWEPPEGLVMDACESDEEKKERTKCCTDPSKPVLAGADMVDLRSLEQDTPPTFASDDIQAILKTNFQDYKFNFVSEENKNTFLEDPWKYAPILGGFCSFGIAKEKQYDRDDAVTILGPYADFPAWGIYDDHVYMFGGAGPRKFFMQEPEESIELASNRWINWFPDTGTLFDGAMNTACFHRSAAGRNG